MKSLERLADWIAKLLDIIGGFMLVTVTLVAFVNFASRYLFHAPLMWADELATSCFVWVIFIGSASHFRHKGHICIEFFYDIVPNPIKRLLDAVGNVILLLSSAYFTHLAFTFAVGAIAKRTPVLKISYFIIDISAAVCFAAITLFALLNVVRIFLPVGRAEEENS